MFLAQDNYVIVYNYIDLMLPPLPPPYPMGRDVFVLIYLKPLQHFKACLYSGIYTMVIPECASIIALAQSIWRKHTSTH